MNQPIFGQWLSSAGNQTERESTVIFLNMGLENIAHVQKVVMETGSADFLEYKYLVRAIENCKRVAGKQGDEGLDFEINLSYVSEQLDKVEKIINKELPHLNFNKD